MALLLLDSFDHYNTAQGFRKWTAWGGGITPGRTGNGAEITIGPAMTFGPEYQTLAAGVAYKTSAFSNNIIKFYNSPVGYALYLGHAGDGRLKVTAGYGFSGGATSPLSTYVMLLNDWYYVEMKSTVSVSPPVSGSFTVSYTYDVYINEALIMTGVLNISVGGTPPGGSTGFATFGLEGRGGGLGSIVDDVYCTDGEILGDIKVGVLYPNAPGDLSAWTPTAAPNWSNVEEHISDDDATTVTAATAGLKDLYNLDNIPAGFVGVIKGVQALWLVKKSDAGPAFVKGLWKSGATELTQTQGYNYIAPKGYPVSYVDYLYSREPERSSLFTSADWTIAEINALQLGITRTI